MMLIQRGGGGKHAISKAQQLEILSRLHDEGKLSDEEFEAEKRTLSQGGG
ncbi:MAG: SHOCT domain-containing protein [Acidimicrobiia bacterium]